MSDKSVRAYMLLGPELGEKSQRLQAIRGELKSEFNSDPEIHRFYPFEALEGEVTSTLTNNSLFADHRLVILSQAEDLSSSQVSELETYLNNPTESATLVLISAQNRLSNKLTSLIPKNNVLIFYEMFENRKVDWLRNLFAQNKSSITLDAAELLLELVENNTQELRSTSLQLIQFATNEGETTVSEKSVEQFIKHTRSESVFSLFEQLIDGTYERALSILATLLDSQEGQAISLIGGLLWQFRRLTSLHELVEAQEPLESAFSKVAVMGKISAIKRKRDQQSYANALKRYSLENCRSIIARLAEYDIRVKEEGTEFQKLLLEQLVGVIMRHKGNAPQGLHFLSYATDVVF